MKKIKNMQKVFALTLMGALALVGLAGCFDDKAEELSPDTQSILERLDTIQSQMDAVEASLGELAGDDKTEIVMAGLENAQQFSKQFDDLEERVSAAAITADSAAVPENEDDRPAAYFEAIAPLEELRHELEQLESAFITAHGNGTVGSEELWGLESRKGEIEDMIALAEETLEFRMSASGEASGDE